MPEAHEESLFQYLKEYGTRYNIYTNFHKKILNFCFMNNSCCFFKVHFLSSMNGFIIIAEFITSILNHELGSINKQFMDQVLT